MDNLDPHKPARVAMILFNERYAQQCGGSMDFWESLTDSQRDLCRNLVAQIECSREETNKE